MRSKSIAANTSKTHKANLFLNTILRIFYFQTQTNSTDPSINSVAVEAKCPAFSPFPFWLHRQCPLMKDFRCVVGLPGDLASPIGQLNCATADDLPNARLKLLTAQEMLNLVKYRDAAGRPWCLLSLFYSPDCVFSAKVADSFYQIAPIYPKLHVIAIDVSQGGKDTESLISQYGIASTPVIALWQDGFPRYRLYDDYSKLNSLVKVIRAQTDLRPRNFDEKAGPRELDENTDLGHSEKEPSRQQFLAKFKYLQEDLGFDWFLLAAVLTCLINLLYFGLSSRKGRAFIEQYFTALYNIVI